MQPAIRLLCLTFTAVLSAAAIGAAPATAPAPATPQLTQEDELDEVWIRGKRLADVIEDAEDELFKLYNKLNRNHDYDVQCGEMSLESESLALVRTCIPGFIAYGYFDLGGRPVRQCSSGSMEVGSVSNPYFGSTDNSYYYAGCTWAPLAPPELLAMAHRERYRDNVLRVIGSDPRLQKMGKTLAGLYTEMSTVQNHYVRLKGTSAKGAARPARSEVRPTRPVKALTGPRVL